MAKSKSFYAKSGVDYSQLDSSKLIFQAAAAETSGVLKRFGCRDFPESRGESVHLIEMDDCFLAQVIEGLGTKNLPAQEMQDLTGCAEYWRAIAQDNAAMFLNDLITLGALLIDGGLYLADSSVGSFHDIKGNAANHERLVALAEGTRDAFLKCEGTWGFGETPTLKNIIVPGTIDLAGCAMGMIMPKERLMIGSKIRHGDAIIALASSGIGSNGLTAARTVKDALPDGYLTPCGDSTFGDQLLKPTLIYHPVVEAIHQLELDAHYAVNVTGHGWAKLPRAPQPFHYVVTSLPLPQPHPIFPFLQEHMKVDDREMYSTFNMGCGFVIYINPEDADTLIKVACDLGFFAWEAGEVHRAKTHRSVTLKQLGITYDAAAIRL